MPKVNIFQYIGALKILWSNLTSSSTTMVDLYRI